MAHGLKPEITPPGKHARGTRCIISGHRMAQERPIFRPCRDTGERRRSVWGLVRPFPLYPLHYAAAPKSRQSTSDRIRLPTLQN